MDAGNEPGESNDHAAVCASLWEVVYHGHQIRTKQDWVIIYMLIIHTEEENRSLGSRTQSMTAKYEHIQPHGEVATGNPMPAILTKKMESLDLIQIHKWVMETNQNSWHTGICRLPERVTPAPRSAYSAHTLLAPTLHSYQSSYFSLTTDRLTELPSPQEPILLSVN